MGDDGDTLRIVPLGAGAEVGRSCVLLRFKGKTVMLDCGVHPAHSGMAALPFFDEVDPAEVDLVLVTHFHLDHAAALPYWTEKTNFRGRVFMTHPTKAIFRWLLADYVRVSGATAEDGGPRDDASALYSEADLARCHERITPVDYHQEVEVDGVRFVALNAGHVLGAAMFAIEIAGVRVLYTGDYSREEDRHLMAAETPTHRPDVLVTESTYGVHTHQPRAEREARFTGLVHEVVARGGRCLIPVFALGRAQELLLILDEYWGAHPELHGVPVYYASSLARKCMAVYQTYVNMMNERIRRAAAVANPFVFRHVSYLRSLDGFSDTGPAVVMASPAMLQSGMSRQLLEAWAPSPRNGLVVPGYVVDGTLAKLILSEPREFPSSSGGTLPLRMTVEYISFSAHVDFAQNAAFIDALRPPHVVLVHGEANEMARLRAALMHRYGLSEKACAQPAAFLIGGSARKSADERTELKAGLAAATATADATLDKADNAHGKSSAEKGSEAKGDGKTDAKADGKSTRKATRKTDAKADTTSHGKEESAVDTAENEKGKTQLTTSKVPLVDQKAEDDAHRIVNIHTPRNGEAVELAYRGERVVKVVGSLGARMSAPADDDAPLEGVLVAKDFEYQLVAPADLHEFVHGVRALDVRERQALTCRAPFSLVEFLLVQLLGQDAVKRTGPHDLSLAGGCVSVQCDGADSYVVEWAGNPMNDVVADAVVMLLLGAESSKLAVKATVPKHDHGHSHSQSHSHSHEEAAGPCLLPGSEKHTDIIAAYLENHYGLITRPEPDVLAFSVDGQQVEVTLGDELDVACRDPAVAQRVSRILGKIVNLLHADYVL